MPSFTLEYSGSRYTIFGDTKQDVVRQFLMGMFELGIEEFQVQLKVRKVESEEWVVVDVKEALANMGIETQRRRDDGTSWFQITD